MARDTQIQPPHTAGTGDRVRNPAGESLVGTEPETGRSGEATGKVVALIAGGELHAEPAGSRVNIVILTGKGLRNRLTASLSPADAERFFKGGAEIVALARSYRQAKGA